MVTAGVNPFLYELPQNTDELISLGNANGYLWSYLDTSRENGVAARPVPDGWAYAWVEYTRRATTYRMAIREAFRLWRDTATLPGLS